MTNKCKRVVCNPSPAPFSYKLEITRQFYMFMCMYSLILAMGISLSPGSRFFHPMLHALTRL